MRLILALIGLLIAEVGYWAAGQRINFITIAFGVLSAIPYLIYARCIRTPAISVMGGIALMSLPAAAYGDYYLGSDSDGVSFAFATVPIANLLIVAALIAIDQVLSWVRPRGKSSGTSGSGT